MTSKPQTSEKEEKEKDYGGAELLENEFYDLEFCENFDYFENDDMSWVYFLTKASIC